MKFYGIVNCPVTKRLDFEVKRSKLFLRIAPVKSLYRVATNIMM